MLHSSAAPLPPELVKKAYQKFNIPVKLGYGASEAAPGISSQSWTDWDKSLGSSGRLLPLMQLKVMIGGREVSLEKPGELWISDLNIFRGYLKNQPATKLCLDADSYYFTGDFRLTDQDYNILITDRVKELIKYNRF